MNALKTLQEDWDSIAGKVQKVLTTRDMKGPTNTNLLLSAVTAESLLQKILLKSSSSLYR